MTEESQTQPPSATKHSHAAQRFQAAVAGRFELLAELGSGSSGTVHHARLLQPYAELPAGGEVAIKFLRAELLADERAHERFRSEAELGQSLHHKNLAAIHGVETVAVDGTSITFLIMQFVQGTTLRDFVRQQGRPVEDLVRRIGADAAAGLFALHRKGLVHRDVKPENLILTPKSELKIVDLGLVRPFGGRGSGSGSSTSSGHGLGGTVAYTAPEALHQSQSGPKSDLYSLGVVLYEVSCGHHPFVDCKTPDDMLLAHLERVPQPLSHVRPGVSPFLEQLLADLLQKDPDRRPRDAADLGRIFEQGEHSDWWRKLEEHEPVRGSQRRLIRMRRPADTEFIGRAGDLERLEAAFERAAAGRGSVVVVTGPVGSGRRRLCDTAMERWLGADRPPLLLGGEADLGLGHAEPFAGAVLDLLLRGDGRDSPNAEARAAATARVLFALPEPAALALARVALGHSTEAPEVRADRLASALLQLPRKDRAVVLRVDHAEHLDTSGRLVLHRLLAAAPLTELLVLLCADLDGIPIEPHERVELGGLEEDEFLHFARAQFRHGEVDDGFLLAAHQTMSGVPGTLVEALDHLVQEGLLRGRPTDYHGLRPGVELRPAPGHLMRFQQRVATFDPVQRDVLSAAAVLGRSCLLGALAELCGLPELAVLETLSLFRGRIVRAQGGEVWFRHRDFQKVLLDAMPAVRRRELHREAAALLERLGRSRLEIGMHHSQALDHEACLDPLLDGLDELVTSGSRRTALRIANRIAVHLEQARPGPVVEAQRLRFLLLQAAARENNGQRALALRSLQAAETLARELGDLEASAQARLGIAGGELATGHLLTAIAMLEAVHDDLDRLTSERADRLAARAHGLHGRILLYRGHAKEGHRHLQAALGRLPDADTETRCHLLIDLARLEALQHHYPTALKTLHAVDKTPAAKRFPRVRLRLLLYRGQIRALLADDEATQDLRTALDDSLRLSLPAYACRASLFLGERQFWRQRDDDARRQFEAAREHALAAGDRLGEAMARAYLVRLGATDPELPAIVDELAMPTVTSNWLLALAAQDRLDADGEELLQSLVDDADLPLSLHLRALAQVHRPASARSLVRSIADRIPERRDRRRFLAAWAAGARI